MSSPVTHAARVHAGLRAFIKATKLAFPGDAFLQGEARNNLRAGFIEHKHYSPTSTEALACVKHLEDLSTVLTTQVIQGQRQAENQDKFYLNIHDKIERGDNDSIKTAGKNTLAMGGGCCGGSGKK
ncbi:hypothetical protein NADFUDRAFT_51524 [Nadsonia fulvescens var. elongata DSM 6958]|uniref:Mitochondrial zinc maintenance protein 1, mitochondrial n=1 Tax=Nadsonia fulvescens var. elongata DSM 6958 TaxID=857566 RepID=A0A1E3PHM9_9ASCO|nr:hypothetical protein NADFUDRAFT_51524 [Nadsonia fulvescens var. elongata DSM 6958]